MEENGASVRWPSPQRVRAIQHILCVVKFWEMLDVRAIVTDSNSSAMPAPLPYELAICTIHQNVLVCA
jgi:hypothetical protein